MITVPAFVWRGGFFGRAVTIGATVGICLGALAWLDSGFLLSGVAAFVVNAVFFGIWMPRRMNRYWPGAKQLSGDERVSVVRTTRRGERIGDARLAQAIIDYSTGMHTAAEQGRPYRWLLVFILFVAMGMAGWDAVLGSWGNAVASGIYLVLGVIELFWWPKRRERLLTNADRAVDIAAHLA